VSRGRSPKQQAGLVLTQAIREGTCTVAEATDFLRQMTEEAYLPSQVGGTFRSTSLPNQVQH
jgi:hypothetical protein